jgi:hypothetical protein
MVQVFGEKAGRATLFGSGQDHPVPERKLPNFADFGSADDGRRGDRKLNSMRVIPCNFPGCCRGKWSLDLACHVDVKLRTALAEAGVSVMSIDEDIGINEGLFGPAGFPDQASFLRQDRTEYRGALWRAAGLADSQFRIRQFSKVHEPAWRSNAATLSGQSTRLLQE